MANITVRNIPDAIFKKIKALSSIEKRSLNSEILMIIERGTSTEFEGKMHTRKYVSKDTQLSIWKSLLGKWSDKRSTKEIIEDIYSHRTIGRKVKL
jgi:plasmid stability protein